MIGKRINFTKNTVTGILLYALIIVAFNFIANEFYFRLDLTKEKRYTLSPSSIDLVNKLDDDLYVTIFLDGDLPIEYKQLRSATRDILNEYRLLSEGKIKFDFEDILADKDIKDKETILKEIFQKGLQIEQPELKPDEAPTEKYILPSGIVFYKGKEYPINLLKRQFGKSLEVEINNSIELLEYEIGTAIRKGLSGKSIKVAFSAGHGELSSTQTADIANSYDRDVFAIPGRINDVMSKGCNDLIYRNKAHLLKSSMDLVKMLNWDISPIALPKQIKLFEELPKEHQKVVDYLQKQQQVIDVIALDLEMSVSNLATILLQLELKGIVKPIQGKIFKLS